MLGRNKPSKCHREIGYSRIVSISSIPRYNSETIFISRLGAVFPSYLPDQVQ
jgi:hypothetical protein